LNNNGKSIWSLLGIVFALSKTAERGREREREKQFVNVEGK
jgi:hypothetical protein